MFVIEKIQIYSRFGYRGGTGIEGRPVKRGFWYRGRPVYRGFTVRLFCNVGHFFLPNHVN